MKKMATSTLTTTTTTSTTSSSINQQQKSGSMKRSNNNNPIVITKEIEEHVAQIIGLNQNNNKIIYKTIIKFEIKADKKYDNRLLIITKYRLYLFIINQNNNKYLPPKLEHSINIIDLNLLESKQLNRLLIGFRSSNDSNKYYCFQQCDNFNNNNNDETIIDKIIYHLINLIRKLFPFVSYEMFIKQILIEPRKRFDNIINYLNYDFDDKLRIDKQQPPCGNFSNQYACFCDYYGITYRDDVAWDIDTIYASHNNQELSILDFEHLDLKDLLPIIAALTYNGYFTKFRISNVKIFNNSNNHQSGSEQICELIINLVRRSTRLEEIYLDNTGIRSDFVNKLFQAMLLNNQTSIQIIDLSNNQIEDKGLRNMTSFVAKSFHMANINNNNINNNNNSMIMINNSSSEDLSSSLSLNFSSCSTTSNCNNNNDNTITSSAKLMYKGLVHLNLSHCSITSKGISELSESLYLNKSMFTTLTYLNLSDNCFKDDLSKLYNFLAQPNNIAHLDLSGTECNIDSVFGALLHGCTNNLVHLNLSRNQFNNGKKSSHKEFIVPVSIKKFFSTAIFLRTINLSHNRLPTEALKAILLGLACNESANDLRINLSSNEFKSNGAAVLELCLSDIRCVSGLDLSDNNLDMDLIQVVQAIAKNKSIKYLSIGRNFNNIKAKHLPKVLDSFVALLQDPDCSIESLSLIDSKLKTETSIILNALGSNQSLINIDISGNLMGLIGAKTLAKALQINNHLETIYMDRNVTPTTGFIDIAYSLERNFTLKYLPIPIQDVQAAMMKMPDRTEAAINKIQEFLRRNNQPQTIALRNLRLNNYNNIVVDNNLFIKIDKIAQQLQNLLRERQLDNEKTLIYDDSTIIRIENLLHDVRNIRTIYYKIQDISQTHQTILQNYDDHHHHYLRRGYSTTTMTSTTTATAISRPIEMSILEYSRDARKLFENQVKIISETIIQCIKDEFPTIFYYNQQLENDLRDLYKCCSTNNNTTNIPSIEYFQSSFNDIIGIQWSMKLEQILNTITSQICNKFLHEIDHCLMINTQRMIDNVCDDEFKSINTNVNNNGITSSSTIRSITPSDLRSQTWIESFNNNNNSNSSQDSNDLLSLSAKQDFNKLLLDPDNPENTIATPKLGNQKRQNVYIRKLRPQSVLDGTITTINDFDLINNNDDRNQSDDLDINTIDNLNNEPIKKQQQQHLTKNRAPRNRKIRAPTRVTIVDSNKKNNHSKIDEGLDNFFPTISLIDNQKQCSLSNASIESKEIEQILHIQQHHYPNTKPQPQPRKILRKLGFKSQSEQMHSLDKSDKQSSLKPNEELIRSNSPIFGTRRSNEHVSICNNNNTNDLIDHHQHHHHHHRVHSPLPSLNSGGEQQQHNELLAEMKAVQEKRSYNSTPVSNEQLTFASTIEEKQQHNSDDDNNDNDKQKLLDNDNMTISVAKRATIFGDLHKSPSKHSITSPTDDNNGEVGFNQSSNNNKNQQSSSSSKQRPKSMVGMLGAKFELSLSNK